MLRYREIDGELYINKNDLIENIEDHKSFVCGDKPLNIKRVTYELAHEHIIDLINKVELIGDYEV